jgi:exonuclease SbcC
MIYDMTYIKKVILENFQSHKHTEILFDEHLNVIVGPSDQGKSAIIRGIQWALFNEPSGDFFIREGEKECSIIIYFSDNTAIKRYKSRSKNLYYYYDEFGKETIYEGFGLEVPKEIVDKIKIRKIFLSGKQSNAINISEQLEGPFLLSENTNTRANAIGRLIGVHIVDDAIKDTLKDKTNLNSLKKNNEEQYQNLSDDLKKYDYLDDLKRILDKFEIIQGSINEKQAKLEKLIGIRKDYIDCSNNIGNVKSIINRLENIDIVKEKSDRLNNCIRIYNIVNSKKVNLINIDEKINENLNILKYSSNMDKMGNILINLDDKTKKLLLLKSIDEKYRYINKNLSDSNLIIENLKTIYIVSNMTDDIEKNIHGLNNLSTIYKNLMDLDKRIEQGNNYIKKFKNISEGDLLVQNISGKLKGFNTFINVEKRYTDILSNINNTNKIIKDEKDNISLFLEEYKSLLLKLGICPLCLSKIDSKTIEKIISNYS